MSVGSLPLTPTANGRLLAALHVTGTTSRAEATALARLARSAAGGAVDELQELGIIDLRPPDASESRGRPSPVLGLRRPGPWVAACELRTDSLRIAAGHLGRSLTAARTILLDATASTPEETLRAVGEHVSRFIDEIPGPCVGVGLSLPGMVDPDQGVATAILSLSWHGVRVRELLRPRLPAGLHLVIGQDAEFAAIGEHRMGAGVGAERLLFLLGQAVGLGGLVVGNRSEWSSSHHPLQAGHIVVDPNGPRCLCGERGCLEVFVDGRAVARALGAPFPLTPEAFEALVAAGLSEDQLDAIRREIVPKLRLGLVSLVNVLGPDRVVLGGVLAPILDIAEQDLRTGLGLSVVADVEHVSLVRSTLQDAVLFGAAEVALQPLLHDPRAVMNETRP